MAFSSDSKYLVTLGVQGDDIVAVWDVSSGQTGTCIVSSPILNQATNQVKVDPFPTQNSDGADYQHMQFLTVGNDAALTTWRFDVKTGALASWDQAAPASLRHVHFLSMEFARPDTQQYGYCEQIDQSDQRKLVIIGCSNGAIVAYDDTAREYVDAGGEIIDGAIGAISIKPAQGNPSQLTIVLASSRGCLCRYPLVGAQAQPQYPNDVRTLDFGDCGSAIVAMSMDEYNNEGVVGTENGQIFLVDFEDEEKPPIAVVSSNNINRDAISLLKIDPMHREIFVSNCGQKSAGFNINALQHCDLIQNNQNNLEDDGYVVFIISAKNIVVKSQNKDDGKEFKNPKRLVGFSNGVIKRFNFQNLSAADRSYKLPLNPGEVLTCGYYSENDWNFVVGTNHGTIFFCSMKHLSKTGRQVAADYCRIENVSRSSSFADVKVKSQKNLNPDIFNDNESELTINREDSQDDLNLFVGVTSIHCPSTEPIGVLLVAFDDGTIRLWKSVEKNKQMMKIFKLKQEQLASKANDPRSANAPVKYDISEVGYQQFDLVDSFDIFQNPHNERQDTEEERNQTKSLYSYKKHPSCEAKFAPESTTKKISMADQYFCFVEALPYIFIRNFEHSSIIHRINLSKPTQYPTSMKLFDARELQNRIDEDALLRGVLPTTSGNFLIGIGTKEGRVYVYRYSATVNDSNKLFASKPGTAFGAITALDISQRGDDMLAGTETGEVHQWALLAKINEQ